MLIKSIVAALVAAGLANLGKCAPIGCDRPVEVSQDASGELNGGKGECRR